MSAHAVIVPKVRDKVNLEVAENGTMTVADIAECYAKEFSYYRRCLAERLILAPRGLDFDKFLNRLHNHNMPHYQLEKIDNQMVAFGVDASAIISGIDRSGAHIFKVVNPGVVVSCDTECFACIGAGEPLATTQFMVSRFDKNWSFPSSLWLAFYAKARAQSTGGVGRKTDLSVITAQHRIVDLDDGEKKQLFELYDSFIAEEEAASNRAVSAIQSHIDSFRTPSGEKSANADLPDSQLGGDDLPKDKVKPSG